MYPSEINANWRYLIKSMSFEFYSLLLLLLHKACHDFLGSQVAFYPWLIVALRYRKLISEEVVTIFIQGLESIGGICVTPHGGCYEYRISCCNIYCYFFDRFCMWRKSPLLAAFIGCQKICIYLTDQVLFQSTYYPKDHHTTCFMYIVFPIHMRGSFCYMVLGFATLISNRLLK